MDALQRRTLGKSNAAALRRAEPIDRLDLHQTGLCEKEVRQQGAHDAKGATAMQKLSGQVDLLEREDAAMLTISPEKVFFFIVKAKEFDAKDAVTEPDPGSNPSDDMDAAVLEDHDDDPVMEEFTSFINGLTEDEQIDLVALMWLGRDDYTVEDWPAVRAEAARAHNKNTARYLLGTPLLGDFLENGLSLLGYSCEEFEMGRL
jgi:hypothetical protein